MCATCGCGDVNDGQHKRTPAGPKGRRDGPGHPANTDQPLRKGKPAARLGGK